MHPINVNSNARLYSHVAFPMCLNSRVGVNHPPNMASCNGFCGQTQGSQVPAITVKPWGCHDKFMVNTWWCCIHYPLYCSPQTPVSLPLYCIYQTQIFFSYQKIQNHDIKIFVHFDYHRLKCRPLCTLPNLY